MYISFVLLNYSKSIKKRIIFSQAERLFRECKIRDLTREPTHNSKGSVSLLFLSVHEPVYSDKLYARRIFEFKSGITNQPNLSFANQEFQAGQTISVRILIYLYIALQISGHKNLPDSNIRLDGRARK